ncbi:hypothetical protein ACOMHN_041635 [Nucella lapillus]
MDSTTSPKLSSRRSQQRKCEKREKLHQQKKISGHPRIHPDVEHAQHGKEKRVFRLCEDSRPMFSPIPGNTSDVEGEDSPRTSGSNKRAKEKLTFPSIHVDRCEKHRPSYGSPSLPPQLSPRHTPHTARDGYQQARSRSPGTGGLNVPNPYLPCKSEGRLLLMTQDSSRGLLGSWSRSEGNLPEAVRKSRSQSHLLDISYRPNWESNPTPRPTSDVALHELRRQKQQQHTRNRRPSTPTHLPVRLEPLNPTLGSTHRTLSATSLKSSSP